MPHAACVVFIDQLSAYKLLTNDGQVTGVAFCDATGTPCHITAGAGVLCAGGATGLFPTVSGDTDNVGNGLVLGYRQAALANLEFVEYTLFIALIISCYAWLAWHHFKPWWPVAK